MKTDKKEKVEELDFSAYKKNWIKEGMEVSHRDNIDVKMYVNKILRQNKSVKVYTCNDEYTVEERTIVLGIEVSYIEDGKMKLEKLHSRILIPWKISLLAQTKGIHVIEKFINYINSL